MARLYRKSTERSLRRKFSKSAPFWIASILVLLGLSCVIKYAKVHLLNWQAQTFPVNQLERGFVSRKRALEYLDNFLTLLRVHQQSTLDEHAPRRNQCEFLAEISKDLAILQSLGLQSLNKEINMLLGTHVSWEMFHKESRLPIDDNRLSRHYITHTFCYNEAKTPQGYERVVDPSFCTRLVDLLRDIQQGNQPPLLTVFTWLPDPLYDTDRFRRRLLFKNWNLLRPIVQPVLFSDSRVYMAQSNVYDWPCLSVPYYGLDGIPIFKNLAEKVARMFNSTFYGYVRPTTAFDASVIETLLKIKEVYLDKFLGNWTQLKGDSQDNVENGASVKPVLVYGRSLRSDHAGSLNTLQYLSQAVNTTEGRIWPERKDSLTYIFYSNMDFSDIPALIVEDKHLTSQLVLRSISLGHQVVDASATLFSIHIVRNSTTNERGREYLHAKPRDPEYNRRLGSLYFQSQGIKKPGKRFNEVATKFSRSGNIFIDIRSGGNVGNYSS